MDIVVTVPRTEIENILKERAWAQQEGEEKAQKYWRISKRCSDTIPKNLQPGDRVYFVENGKITCWQEFVHRDFYDGSELEPGFECEVTDRDWGPGTYLVLKHPVHMLEHPVPMKGFQGFRYINRFE